MATTWARYAFVIILALLINLVVRHEYYGEVNPIVVKENSKYRVKVAGRPNFVFITAEDMSPRLGAYGDELSHTPNLDALASEGIIYTNVHTTSPVCAPSRSSLWTGVHQTKLGTHNMRTNQPFGQRLLFDFLSLFGIRFGPEFSYEAVIPDGINSFTEALRKSGYYVVNTGVPIVKTDYQFGEMLETMWDESSTFAHWKKRPDPSMPFFYYCNFMITHESGLFSSTFWRFIHRIYRYGQPDINLTGSADIKTPPYLPDTRTIREQIARQYNNIAILDVLVGNIFHELKHDNLWNSTVILFTTDHGDGLPRGKRHCYDSGTRVPLILKPSNRFKYVKGSKDERLVSFLDIAPTLLSLASVEATVKHSYMEGKIFFGPEEQPPPATIYCSADRFDETESLKARSIRTKNWRMIENMVVDSPYLAPLRFRDLAPGIQELQRLRDSKVKSHLILSDTKPRYELYNLEKDPFEADNLANSSLEKLAALQIELSRRYDEDLGMRFSEKELLLLMYPGGSQPQAEPVIASFETNDVLCDRLKLETPTSSGTILFRFKRRGYAYVNNEVSTWFLYVRNQENSLCVESLKHLKSALLGLFLEAKTTRYGYKDSEVVSISLI